MTNEKGETFFVGKDVAQALGYAKSRNALAAHVDDEDKKDDTFLGRFILAALAQKSMVTNKIYKSGNKLAGYSVDYREKGFKGIRD